VQRMVELGHTRIAHVTGLSAYVHTAERLRAWTLAMQDAGLSTDNVVEGDFTYEGGARAADRLLSSEKRPTAIFCANDLTALGLMNRASELGYVVPDDLSVAGFDGISMGAYIRPTLTSIRTDPRALGRESARLLLEVIDGETPADVDIPPATVIFRDSLGPVTLSI